MFKLKKKTILFLIVIILLPIVPYPFNFYNSIQNKEKIEYLINIIISDNIQYPSKIQSMLELSKINSDNTIEKVIKKFINSNDINIKINLIQTLGYCKSIEAKNFLLSLLYNKNWLIRFHSIDALSNYSFSPIIEKAIYKLLKIEKKEQVLINTLSSLKNLIPKIKPDNLRPFLNSQNDKLRIQAEISLYQYGFKEYFDILINNELNSNNKTTSRFALILLGHHCDNNILPHLIRLKKNSSDDEIIKLVSGFIKKFNSDTRNGGKKTWK